MTIADTVISCNFEELDNVELPLKKRFELIVMYKNVKYEFLVNIKDNQEKVLVLGSGGIPEEYTRSRKEPYYNRFSWPFQESIINYNDPTHYLSDEFNGSWGVGTIDDWYLENIAAIIKKLTDKIYKYTDENKYKNIIFHGSSMGGFMSIMLSILVENSTSIAEIPQLEVLNQTGSGKNVLKHCFNGMSKKEANEKFGYRLNVIDLIKQRNYIPNAYLILDCSYDVDFERQYKPFFDKLNQLPYNEEFNNIKIRIDGKNKGHTHLEYSELSKVIRNVNYITDNSHMSDESFKKIIYRKENEIKELKEKNNKCNDEIVNLKNTLDLKIKEVNSIKKDADYQKEYIDYLNNKELSSKLFFMPSIILLMKSHGINDYKLNKTLYDKLLNSNYFSTGYYLKHNNDLKEKVRGYMNPQLHYICYGFDEKRKINQNHDPTISKEELLKLL